MSHRSSVTLVAPSAAHIERDHRFPPRKLQSRTSRSRVTIKDVQDFLAFLPTTHAYISYFHLAEPIKAGLQSTAVGGAHVHRLEQLEHLRQRVLEEANQVKPGERRDFLGLENFKDSAFDKLMDAPVGF